MHQFSEDQQTNAISQGYKIKELMIMLGTVGIILSIAIPNFRALKREDASAKVEDDLKQIKSALMSYWKSNHQTYPENIHEELIGASPVVLTQALPDPWKTDSQFHTYGYQSSTDPTFGNYFIIYSKGPNGDTRPFFNAAKQRVEYSGSGRVVSNAPIRKIP